MLVGIVVTVVAAARPGAAGHQGAARRGAARRDSGRREGVEAARRHRRCPCWQPERPACSRAVYGDAPMLFLGVGLVGVLVGVIVAMPLAVRPLTALIAAPMRLRGLPGELAKQNAMRNTRRTASTAAALMIGLTLVVSMSVFASSLKDSFGEVIGDKTNADLFLTASSSQGPGFSPSVVDAVADVAGVDEVSASRLGSGSLRRVRLELLGDRPGQRRRR